VGGKIQGVSLDSFLQIVQMDRITCTLNVISQEGSGFLYFIKGELFAATTGELHNVEAACRIISWEDAVIEINNSCDQTENKINQPLMNILMEGMRLRDEAAKSRTKAEPDTAIKKGKKKGQKASGTEKQDDSAPAVDAPPPLSVGKGQKSEKRLVRDTEPTAHYASPHGKKKIFTVALPLIVILCGLGLTVYLLKARQLRLDYNAVLSRVETIIPLEKKRLILQEYLQKNNNGEFASDTEKRIKDIEEQLVQQDLSTVEREADLLIQNGDLEQALSLYTKLEQKYPEAHLSGRISEKKNELSTLIDTRAHETLIRLSKGKGAERVLLYAEFLKAHPGSSHRPEIEKRVSEIADEFYRYTEQQILENEKSENWKKSLGMIQQYIDIYPYSEHTGVLKKYQSLCEEEIRDGNAFADLLKRGEALGNNYDQVIKIYTDYLNGHPHTRAKNKINQEIEKNKALSEKKRVAFEIQKMTDLLSGSSDRFIVHPNGTVKDNKTGLMWNLIDSTTFLNRCIDYQEAANFVKTLDTGGYTDWRLPTPEELTALYRQKPYFPSPAPMWYWTSQIHKRYLGRWMVDVDVVSTETSTEEEIKNKESWHCGAVRAVRGNR